MKLLLALCLSTMMAHAEQVVLQTKNTTMVLNVENGRQPQYVYYGTKLRTATCRQPST